jgi:hypothetical protein
MVQILCTTAGMRKTHTPVLQLNGTLVHSPLTRPIRQEGFQNFVQLLTVVGL